MVSRLCVMCGTIATFLVCLCLCVCGTFLCICWVYRIWRLLSVRESTPHQVTIFVFSGSISIYRRPLCHPLCISFSMEFCHIDIIEHTSFTHTHTLPNAYMPTRILNINKPTRCAQNTASLWCWIYTQHIYKFEMRAAVCYVRRGPKKLSRTTTPHSISTHICTTLQPCFAPLVREWRRVCAQPNSQVFRTPPSLLCLSVNRRTGTCCAKHIHKLVYLNV